MEYMTSIVKGEIKFPRMGLSVTLYSKNEKLIMRIFDIHSNFSTPVVGLNMRTYKQTIKLFRKLEKLRLL